VGNHYSGNLVGAGLRFGIVSSRWNDFMGNRLLDGARDVLIRHGVDEADVDVAMVPGSFELPLAAQKMAESGRYDAVICLGVVIRGATPHFEYVAGEAAKGIARASLQSGVPVTFGVVTSDTVEQAIERAGSKAGNKGAEAALAAIEMANLMRALAPPDNGLQE
jgi:6,7-dimethyl-8-ribityllumazine synthase